ncbi:MAG: glycosyltransferase [Nocardioidaceae bacterium]
MSRQSEQPRVRGNEWRSLQPPAIGAWEPRLSVSMVIPAHQPESTLAYCLAGLAAQTYPAHLMQVLVVDDGSDPPVVLPDRRPENTQVLRTSESWGRAHACAEGAAYAEGDVIHWLDADMLLHHDEVEAQLRWHHLIDHAVVLGHKLFVDPTEGLADVETVYEIVRAGRAGDMFEDRWTARHDWVEEFSAKHDGLNAAAFHAYLVHVGASASVRRDFYETSGGMDSDLKLGEDVELGYRLAQRGALFVPDSQARSWHLGRSTLMLRQEEVNRYNRPFVTDRITDLRHWRTKGRTYSVPWLQAVVQTEGASYEAVAHTVDGLLRSSVADLEIVLLGDWVGRGDQRRPTLEDEHLDSRMLNAEYVGEPRVRFQKEVGTTAFPSAWRLEIPAGWAPGKDSLRKLTREANNQVRGLVSVTMPDGAAARFERTSSFARALRLKDSREDIDDVVDSITGTWWYDGPEEGFTHVSSRARRLSGDLSRAVVRAPQTHEALEHPADVDVGRVEHDQLVDVATLKTSARRALGSLRRRLRP